MQHDEHCWHWDDEARDSRQDMIATVSRYLEFELDEVNVGTITDPAGKLWHVVPHVRVTLEQRACEGCGAEKGDECEPDCLGLAAQQDRPNIHEQIDLTAAAALLATAIGIDPAAARSLLRRHAVEWAEQHER